MSVHKEYIRIVSGAETAVLFIHGIVGTPNHFSRFIPLVPQSFSVYNILLEGHGRGVRDFAAASMGKWKKQVKRVVSELLATHNNIIIVAHSMGTLFAVREAVENSKRIKALFLLAAPLKLAIKPQMVKNSLKVLFDRIAPNDKYALAAKHAYGIENDKRLWLYFGWIPRYMELFSEIKATRKIIPQLNTRTYLYQSRNDEMVALSSLKYLQSSDAVTVNILKNSSHYYYEENDYNYLLKEFKKLLECI